jgi:hypothetical protein
MKKNSSILLLLMIAIILSGCASTTGMAGVTPSPSVTKRLTSTPTLIHKPQTAEATPVEIKEVTVPVPVETSTISPTPYPKLAPIELQHYIGLIVPPYPLEFQYFGGSFLDPPLDRSSLDKVYRYTDIKIGREYFMFLEKAVDRDENGSFIWKILDILKFPVLNEHEVIIREGCMLNDQKDYEITVIGLLDEEAFYERYLTNEKIRFAWRADRQKEVFVKIINDGIECKADMAWHWVQ